MPTINGTTGNDLLVGTDGDDIINGGDGNDTLRGGLGNDTLNGGSGADHLSDDSGNDTLDGGSGDDTIYLYRIYPSSYYYPTDHITVIGGDGNDQITDWAYGWGTVTIDAGAGDDHVMLVSSSHDHRITLGSGRDFLIFDNLVAHWTMETARVVTDFQPGAGGDTIILDDMVSRYGQWDGETDPFASGALSLIQRGSDAVLQMRYELGVDFTIVDLLVFENTSAANFNADNFGGFSPNGIPSAPLTLTGTIDVDILTGGYGNDVIEGSDGGDYLYGLAGNDMIRGGDGNDQIFGGFGDDLIEGGAGHDYIDLSHEGGSDSVDSGTGNDFVQIYRNWRDLQENVTVVTGEGDDQLFFQNFDFGTLTADLGAGNDRFTLWGARQDIDLTLGADADVVDFSSNYATLIGEMLVTITDFVAGQDSLIWRNYLRNELLDWNPRLNPFETGHLRFEQQGSDLVLFIDRDGAADFYSEHQFLVLENVTQGSLTFADMPWHNIPANDFNGDGRSDVLWRNADGTVGNWLANEDGTFTSNGASVVSAGSSWQVAGTGDFNGDGRDDILWRNSTGEIGVWQGLPNGSYFFDQIAGVKPVATSWQVESIGDFNGDGRDDILWRSSTGDVGTWSGTLQAGFTPNNDSVFHVSTDWHIAATGDFNGDGKDDILWRDGSGTIANWLSNGGGFAPNFASVAGISNDWHIVGTGDFNKDGRDDILWRHDSGTVANWTANADGTFSPNFASLVTITNDWNIASIGDFNGDGRDDILWRHDSGTVANWIADNDNSGTFTTDVDSFVSIPNAWQVQDAALLVL